MDYSKAIEALNKGYSIPNLEARSHLMNLNLDPDYQKQMRMGDIEFEMEMMDDMLYGKPAIENTNGDVMNHRQLDRLNELDSIFGTQAGDVDELGIAALRDWAMNTSPLKYIDTTPYDLDVYDQERKFVGTSPEGLDRYYGGHYGYGIDINMDQIMKPNPKAIEYYNKKGRVGKAQKNPRYDPYALGNRISDVYRHELKHWILNNREPFSHPAIYGTGARFGISNLMASEASQMFKDPSLYEQNPFRREKYASPHSIIPEYSQDVAGDYTREVIADQNKRTFRREPPRPEGRTHHLNTGGLASLML